MYSGKRRKKAKTNSVQVRSSNNRLQLVFSFKGKRYFVSTGLGDSPYNRKQAYDKAFEVERDIDYGGFDPNNLGKYKVGVVLTTAEKTPVPISILSLPEVWQRYSNTRKTGKSPATVRMYGWVANHLDRCPYSLPSESQAIFD